jgi:serine phosphatase RsbU (regulator of sigma subunit)
VTSLLTVDNPPATLRWLTDQFSLGAKFFVAILGSMIKVHLEFFAVVNLVYVAIASALLYQGYRTVTNQRLKTQTLIVIWGIRGAIGLYVVAFILPALGVVDIGPTLKSIITILSLFVGAGSTVYAIVRYQFLDIRLIVRQSLVYTVTSAALVGVYILVINQLGKITKNLFGRDVAPVVDVAFVIVALIFFQPAMTYMDNLIKRFFIRDRSDFRNIAEQFSRNLATIFDLDLLKRNVGKVLREHMLVENVWFCLREGGADSLDLTSESETLSESVVVSVSDPLIGQLAHHQKPVEVDEIGMEAVGKSACWELLVERECRLIVPLNDSKRTLGFVALTRKASGYNYNYEDITTLSILGNQLVTAVTNAWLYQESLEKQRLEEEMALARQIQKDLLPRCLPSDRHLEFAAFTEPARHVGGDYYDFLSPEEEKIGVVVADASGKGMPAALLVSQLQATLRSEVRNRKGLADMVFDANYLIATSTSPEKFVTLFYGELDKRTLKFTYCNAGHNYPVVVRSDGSTVCLETGGLLVGAFANATYQSDTFQLRPGDLVFFYTDGLNEAHNSKEEEFGERRLIDLIRSNRHLPASAITDMVVSEVRSFAEGAPAEDDMTAIVMKVNDVRLGTSI